ncbi:hypothetical protein Bbelb_290450 [Branchiostoma belcheri]|nr:hypothetical protein Bbelb_290450 [Branchiostoma belcheri]
MRHAQLGISRHHQKADRDEAKRRFLVSHTRKAKETWRKLNGALNESYQNDRTNALNRQIEELVTADEKGDYSTTWKVIHDLSGKNQTRSCKVKKRKGSPAASDSELLSEWREYFSSLLNNFNNLEKELPLPAEQDLPILTSPPTLEETKLAIKQLKPKKAAGLDDGITVEALQGGADTIAKMLHSFCAEVYTTLKPPEQWTTNVIIPLPKKGDLTQMTDYRGISLMSISAKTYNKILLNRIYDHIDPIMRTNQAGFRKGRSCVQQIHTLRRIIEGFKNHQLPLWVTYIDFKKAFDCIDREMLFAVLRHYGIPKAVVDAISVLYRDSKRVVMVDGHMSESFQVTTGVLQGDVLAPFLFIIVIDYLLRRATADSDSGIVTHPRASSRYPAKRINDLDFADDLALLESAQESTQAQLSKTASAAAEVGLVVSVLKTKYMCYNDNPGQPLQVYGETINQVQDFTYLGSNMASSSNDLKRRRGLAWSAFWNLNTSGKAAVCQSPPK